MPAVKPGGGASNGPQQQQQQRTTFRPPWVKEGPEPLPLPTAPWTLARARQKAPESEDPATIKANLKPVLRKVSAPSYPGDPSASTSAAPEQPARKTSMITIIPSRPSTDGNAPKENGYDVSSNSSNIKAAPQQKAVPEKTKAQQPQARQIPIEIKSTTKANANKPEEKKIANKPEEKKVEVKVETKPAKRPEEKKEDFKALRKQESKTSQPAPPVKKEEPKVVRKQEDKSESKPPQPPAPPMPPPPMPGMQTSKPVPPQKAAKIEALKSRPRKRPDWGALMKDIENGQKGLKHVQCNDRSTPLLPRVKVKDKFMYESEKPNVHNQLLKEIQGGIKLKRVQTNDRSKPLLEGLRKFRRQLTIEEQIQKAAAEDEEAATEDELDDIDKVRDDLQSTKQMLALELRNKEALERENKKLQTRILNLEVEIEKARAKNANANTNQSPEAWKKEEEQERKRLRDDLDTAQKTVEDLETKYHDTIGQLDMARSDLEDANRKNQALERKLQAALSNQNGELPLTKQPSARKLAPSASGVNRDQQSTQGNKNMEDETETEESEYEYETETSEEEEEEDQEALQERRNAREIKLLTTKLASFKDKENSARKERKSLREQIKKEQKVLKEEKKKYKALQKEVDKMAKLMKDDEDEEDEEEEEEEEESEESESESESEESEEEESDGDLPPDAPIEKRKQNLSERSKRHENCLAALRKGNYLLKATLDRLKDELFKQKEMAVSMQEDLNSVLAELG